MVLRTLLVAVCLCVGAVGCKNEKKKKSLPPPVIENINSATDPKSPTGVAIEINGAHFGSTPGSVRFEEGTNVAEVVPSSSAWSDDGIIVVVPDSGSGGAFSVPGTVTVYVVRADGKVSNGIELDLVDVPTFSPSNMAWDTTTALPTPITGLKAVALPASSDKAYLYISGGQTSTGNVSDVMFLTLTVSGSSFSVSNSWTPTTALPEARAFHAMAYADSSNSPVPTGEAYLYVVGGQANANDQPGGTTTVWYASVNLSDGTVGAWTATTSLPEPRVGHCAIVYRGHLIVLGGLDTSGDVKDDIFIARINSDGSLGQFERSSRTLPAPVAFHTTFAFGAKLYVLGGLTASSTDPNDMTVGDSTDQTYFASFVKGEVGDFTATSTLVKAVKKHIVFNAFGQVVLGEGVYTGWTPLGSTELTSSKILPDGSLDSWGGLTGSQVPGANVFNCAAAMSPIFQQGKGPRFFIIGGMDSSGNRQSTVYMNTAP